MPHWLQTHKGEKKSEEAWSDILCITVFFMQIVPLQTSLCLSLQLLSHLILKATAEAKFCLLFSTPTTGFLLLYLRNWRALLYHRIENHTAVPFACLTYWFAPDTDAWSAFLIASAVLNSFSLDSNKPERLTKQRVFCQVGKTSTLAVRLL